MAIENPFKNLSKPQLYAVVGGGTLVTGYALYRHHKTTGSWSPFATASSTSSVSDETASGSSTTVTDPSTGVTYSSTAIDPLTDMTYAAEIAQYGTVAQAESAVSSEYGLTQSGLQPSTLSTGYQSATGTIGTTTTSGTNLYTSNAAWSQAVQAGLEDVSGSTSYDGTDIGTALGAYLQGQPLTAAQNSLIATAIAEYGPTPQAAPPITLIPTTTTGTTTTGVPTPSSPGPLLSVLPLPVTTLTFTGPLFLMPLSTKLSSPMAGIITTSQVPAVFSRLRRLAKRAPTRFAPVTLLAGHPGLLVSPTHSRIRGSNG